MRRFSSVILLKYYSNIKSTHPAKYLILPSSFPFRRRSKAEGTIRTYGMVPIITGTLPFSTRRDDVECRILYKSSL